MSRRPRPHPLSEGKAKYHVTKDPEEENKSGTNNHANQVIIRSKGLLPRVLLERELHSIIWSPKKMYELKSLGRNVQIHCLKNTKNCPTSSRYGFGIANVFGLEFGINNYLLLSTHSDGDIRAHDRRTKKIVLTIRDGHTEAVNGITNIDEKSFASYSDDMTVLVWDIRKMPKPVKKLAGHTNWVKNAHVMPDRKTIITSGCDHSIRMFDISLPDETVYCHLPIFHFEGLCRSSLHPSGKYLFFTTWKTAVFSINNLDLEHLSNDALHYAISASTGNTKWSIPPFGNTRNSLDVVTYVPASQGVSCGQSLSIHPTGQCCAVRYGRSDDSTPGAPKDWIAVYDFNPTMPIGNGNNGSPDYVQRWKSINMFEQQPTESKIEMIENLSLMEYAEVDLLRHSDISKARMSMLFEEWIEDSGPRTSLKPQDTANTRYYLETENFAPGIIKEVSISPCGMMLSNPTSKGVQILSYEKELKDYDPTCSKKGQVLQVVRELRAPSGDCTTAKFSPDSMQIAYGTLDGNVCWFET